MGQTRNFLLDITHVISVHQTEKSYLLRKYAENPHVEKYYRNQIAVLDQKYEQELKKMVEDHIDYLEENDPYGREPLYGAEAKKELLVQIRQNLETSHGQQFIEKLAKQVENLFLNPIIDQPRWPKLRFDNVYHFFKSVFSNPTAYTDVNDNKKKPSQESRNKPKL